jgi:hypothetical protein
MNLVEVSIASAMAGMVLLGVGAFVASTFHATHNEQDRAFALQKALQMLEEVSATKGSSPDKDLDKLDQDPAFTLTTLNGAGPGDALSANPKVNGHFKYVRQITVAPVSGDDFARQVTVQVAYAGKGDVPALGKAKPLAVVGNIVRANAARVGPRQILDVYALSIENLPHVLRKDDDHQYFPGATEARRAFEGGLRALESHNPWLGFRVHYVTRLAMGRDAAYRPYVNDAKPLSGSGRDALGSAYFYPGRLLPGTDAPRYFEPAELGCNVTLGATAQGSYPACDAFNHAVRWDQEVTVQQSSASVSPLSLRQFLEDMLQDQTGKYRNAIVVNLHGELFPAIPLRNYGDAAKADRYRLVTHPFRLAFTAGADPVRLLVHAYTSDGAPADPRDGRVTIKGVGAYLAGDAQVQVMQPTDAGYQLLDAAPARLQGDDLVADLKDLAFDAGIPAAKRLHGLQYFPDPFLPLLDVAAPVHNTAKAVITFNLAPGAARHHFAVTSELGAGKGQTTIYAVPPGDWDVATRRYASVPATEQVQLVGDPRHNPYLDVRARNLFNPYFADLAKPYGNVETLEADNAFAGLPAGAELAYPHSADGWAGLRFDVPAYMRLWREALVRNDALFVNPHGLPIRFLGQGGEFTLARQVNDAGDLKVSGQPWEGGGGSPDELLGSAVDVERVGGDRWHALPWLGELYPADQATLWAQTGNLSTGPFRRTPWEKLARLPQGEDHREIAWNLGLASLLNAGPVQVKTGGRYATLTPLGDQALQGFGLTPGRTARTNVAYAPSGGVRPPEWTVAPYNVHLGLGWLDAAPYFGQDQGDDKAAAGPLRLTDPVSGHAAVVLADAFRAEGVTQAVPLFEAVAGTMAATYFDAARPALGASNVKPLPRVKLKQPATNETLRGDGADLVWYTRGGRGDGKPYSPLFATDDHLAPEEGGPLDVAYFVKVKPMATDGAWQTANLTSPVEVAAAPATEGEPPAVPPIPNRPRYPEAVRAHWDFSALPAGQYLLRLEAYRTVDGRILPTHFAYHEIPVTIAR